MNGLRKLTAIANTIQAREDWKALVLEADALGIDVEDYGFPALSGWKVIDKHIALLRSAVEKARGEVVDGTTR